MDEFENLSEWEDVAETPDEAQEAPAPEADQPAEPETPAEENAEETTDAEPEAETYQLKHLDEVRNVSREEVIALAQKGMDYDRIRQRYEALSDINGKYEKAVAEKEALEDSVSYLRELAKENGISLDELVDRTQAAAIAKRDEVPMETAIERVKLARRERELSQRERKLQARDQEEEQRKQAADEMQADITRFLNDYPGVDPKSIPAEVWADVNKGASLTAAYAKHEAARLRLELEAERKNRENREKSTGSRSSAGEAAKTDPIDQYWYADD